MTSEGPHHPGQEPDEGSPGTGGSAPYGDRTAQQDNGYGVAAPDLGWAPPPPTTRPYPPTSGWAAQGEQPATAAWAPAPPQQAEQPQPDAWGTQGTQQPAWETQNGSPQPAAWGAASAPQQNAQPQPAWGTASVPQQDHEPPANAWGGQDGSPPPGAWGAASAPQQTEQPQTAAWTPSEPAAARPARATAPVPGSDGPPAWETPGDPPPWTGADGSGLPARPVVLDAQPWSPGEAWGSAESDAAQSEPAANRWEPAQPEHQPIYQPAPGPGISPTNAVPLPSQEHRVPGASLAAAPPAEYAPPTEYTPPAQYAPPAEHPAYADPSSQEFAEAAQPGYGSEQSAGESGWGAEAHGAPQSPAHPVVPQPRTSPESNVDPRAAVPGPEASKPAPSATGGVSASASVPPSSRVMPPADQALRPTAGPAPQPRIYGQPARPEPVDDPEQAEWTGHQPDQGPAPRFDGYDQSSAQANGFAESPAVAPAPRAPLPDFPPGVPLFADPASSTRPANGVKPHSGGQRPAEGFGGSAAPVSGGTAINGANPGYGPAPTSDPAQGGYYPATFSPAPGHPSAQPQSDPSWQHGDETDQSRFDAFKSEAEPKVEQPRPKVRNGRVLLSVLTVAVLILVIPLGLLWLLGKMGS